jgi:hypothetical protein
MGGRFQIWPESIEEYRKYQAKEQSDGANR